MLAASRKETDIGIHPFSKLNLNSNQTDGVFSFELEHTCLMVPWNRKAQLQIFIESGYFLNRWILLVLLFCWPLLWQLASRNGLKGLYYVLIIYHLQPLNCLVFRRLPQAYKIIHIAVLMAILLLRNMRSADLSATFSVKHLGPQIETIEDFMETPLRIMITKKQVEMYFERKYFPEVLRERLVIVSRSTLIDHLISFNTSYAYMATNANANYFNFKQRYMLRPLFRVVSNLETCTPPFFLGLPIQWNSPFKESIFNFYLLSLRSGLQNRWVENTWRHAEMMNMPKEFEPVVEPLGISDFEFSFWMIMKGFGFCTLILLIEIFWKRLMEFKERGFNRNLNV